MKGRRMKSSRSPDIARPVSHVPILDAVRAAVPTLFDGFVLHAFTDETSPPSSHEELVIGGETGYSLEPPPATRQWSEQWARLNPEIPDLQADSNR
jgi:hypothetical protein